MTGGRRRLSLGVLAAVALLLGACGSGGEQPEAVAPTATVAPAPTAAPPFEESPETGEARRIETSEAFLSHLEAGEYEQMVALMTPAYRNLSFGTRTAAQFWTFTSRLAWTPGGPADCDEVGTQVECSWEGTDAVSRVLGYDKRSEFLFVFDGGAVDDIIYFANDSEILLALTRWVDENHPGEPACAATAAEVDAYYGGPGVLTSATGEVFGASCADRLTRHAADYRDSGLYLPPID